MKMQWLKSQGVGLLEIMLALAISAVVILVSVSYYQSANNSQKISAAVTMAGDIYSATQTYAKRIDFNPDDLDIDSLVDAELLTSSSATDPWGGDSSVTADTSGDIPVMVITMESIPDGACTQVGARLMQTMSISDDNGNNDNGQLECDDSQTEYACCSSGQNDTSDLTAQYELY